MRGEARGAAVESLASSTTGTAGKSRRRPMLALAPAIDSLHSEVLGCALRERG